MYVKPGEDRAPRDPHTMLRVPAAGQHVDGNDPSWLTLLRHGDVVEAAAPPEPEPYVEPSEAPEPEPAGSAYEFGRHDPAPAVDPVPATEEHG